MHPGQCGPAALQLTCVTYARLLPLIGTRQVPIHVFARASAVDVSQGGHRHWVSCLQEGCGWQWGG